MSENEGESSGGSKSRSRGRGIDKGSECAHSPATNTSFHAQKPMVKLSKLNPGARLGRYQVESLVHSCACDDVYRATDTDLARMVAIKIMTEPDEQEIIRFSRSAQVALM